MDKAMSLAAMTEGVALHPIDASDAAVCAAISGQVHMGENIKSSFAIKPSVMSAELSSVSLCD